MYIKYSSIGRFNNILLQAIYLKIPFSSINNVDFSCIINWLVKFILKNIVYKVI
jgi:hypothetical protein